MSEQNNELATVNPMLLLQQATKQGVDVAIMEKLMDLQERWEKNQAKKAFDEAMANFQSECPIIKKSKNGGKTDTGIVAYKFAPIEDIIGQTKELIAKHGFSYRIITGMREKMLFADCIVKHKLGYTETTPFEVPPMTGTRLMSAPQIQASTLTFAKRYAFLNAFGIMTGDEDKDAAKQGSTNSSQPAPAKTSPLAPKSTQTYECKCGAAITEAEAKYSQKIYAKNLCRKCQAEAKHKK